MEILKFTAEHMDPLEQMCIFLKIEAEDICNGNRDEVIRLFQKDNLFCSAMIRF